MYLEKWRCCSSRRMAGWVNGYAEKRNRKEMMLGRFGTLFG
jgi:hypothetical protein